MTVNTPILFVLGPSGAGKTTLGQWLAEDLHFLWIEIDQWLADGIDRANLRPEWNEFWDRCQAGAIASTLRARVLNDGARGAVLTFPSLVVFSVQQLAVLEQAGIRVLVLYGSEEDCLAAFLKREKELGRNLPKEHWLANNSEVHKRLGDASYERYRLDGFQSGQRLDRALLTAKVKNRLR
ncbi:MAG: shikimate kinase [Candidatus Sulfotelmatobacter sp.]|jgi:hypothetical protein